MKYNFILLPFIILMILILPGCGSDSGTILIPTATPHVSNLSTDVYVYKFINKANYKNGILVTDRQINDAAYEAVNGSNVKAGYNNFKTDSSGKSHITQLQEGEYQILIDPSTSTNGNDYGPVVYSVEICDPNSIIQNNFPVSMKVVPVKITVPNGQKHQFKCNFKQNNKNVVPPDNIVWTVEGGIGTIDSYGIFTATTAGTGNVIAKWNDLLEGYSEVRVIKDATETGNIHGFVKYENQQVISGAVINIDGISNAGITDVNGEYNLLEVPEGIYTAYLVINNATVRETQVDVKKNKTIELNFTVAQVVQ